MIWWIEFEQRQVESSLIRQVFASVVWADAELPAPQYLVAQPMAGGAVVAKPGRQHRSALAHLCIDRVRIRVAVRQDQTAKEITSDMCPIEHPRFFPIHTAEELGGLERLRRRTHRGSYSMIKARSPG